MGTHNIAEAFTKAGVPVEKQEIRLPHGAIRHTGEVQIDINLHSDVVVTLPISIEAEA